MNHDPALRTALLGFAILVFAMGVGRFAFTPLLPLMEAEGLITIGGGGVLASVHFVGYAAGAMLAGFLRTSPRATLTLSLSLIGLSTAAMGITSSAEAWAIWLIARFVAGVGSAVVLVIVSTHLVRALASHGRSNLQGLIFAGVGAGTALVGFATLGFLALDLSSSVGWLLFGIATIAAAGLAWWQAPAPTSAPVPVPMHAPTPDLPTAPVKASDKQTWRIIVPYGAMGAGYILPATYLPVMAQQAAASPLVYAWGWPVFGMAAALSTLFAARLNKTFTNRQIWITCQVITAAGLVLPALWPGLLSVVVGGICVGGTFMVITMLGMKEAHRLAGNGQSQRLVAAMTAAFALGQIIAPVLGGWAYDATQSFTAPLLLASAALVVSLAPMVSFSAGRNPAFRH